VDVNIAVTFTANPSGGSGTYSSYAWYVNSAQQSSTTSTMSYTFTSSGSYTVEVIVTDSLNFKAYYNYTETINPVLSVSLGVNLNPIDVNVQAAWSASASGGGGSYTYYFYLNGALQSSSGSVFYYTDSSSGSYKVYVKVVDSEGEIAFYNNITKP
jgi:PKD domain.